MRHALCIITRALLGITLSLFCFSIYSSESSPLDFMLSIKKVPQYRNQLELDFAVSSPYGPAASSKIVISSEDVTVDDGTAAWGIPPNWIPLYHQAGHWLQYSMQNNQLSGTKEASGCAVLLSEDVAFSEGFAGWHKGFVVSGIPAANPESVEYTAYCNPDYFPDAIANPQKVAAFNEGFLGDMFDLYNNAVNDPVYTDYRYDENDILIGWDYLHISASNLSSWMGHPYDRLSVLLAAWAQSGKPLAGDVNVCPLLTKYYLEDLCP